MVNDLYLFLKSLTAVAIRIYTFSHKKLRSGLSTERFLAFCDFEYSKFLDSFFIALEIIKGGFWCKLPLFDHFCDMPTLSMQNRDPLFTLSLIICYPSIYNLVFMRDPNWQSPDANRIFRNSHNLL